jgi:protoporphyrinogen/coproporphyrinogen III oxidase
VWHSAPVGPDLRSDTAAWDVVIVGGGAAGLAAASQLPRRGLLLLDEAEQLGGRLRSIPGPDGSWINLGAHVLTGGGSSIAELVTQTGLSTLPVPGVKSALWFGDRLYTMRRPEAYPFVLPLSPRERVALLRTGLRIRALAEGWRRASRRRPGESWTEHRRRLASFQSRRTFSEVLGRPPRRVADVFCTAARRSAGEASDLSAGAAASIFGALWLGSAGATVTNIDGGSGLLGARWQEHLAGGAVCRAHVSAVTERRQLVEVAFTHAGRERCVLTRHVILAVPAPVAATLLSAAPAEVTAQLRRVAYGPFVCLGLATRELGSVPWDGVYAISTPGLGIDMLFHHSSSVRPGVAVPGRKSLMAYAGGSGALELLSASNNEIRRAFLADIARVLPETAGQVAEAIVAKWHFGNCFATPGSSLDSVIHWNRRPRGRVRLAGDYFGALGGTADAAAASGRAAAAAVLAELAAARECTTAALPGMEGRHG